MDFAAANKIGAKGLLGRSWPDLDMLPLGWLTDAGSNRGPYRMCKLNLDEHKTQMTLWTMARSPLMFGGDVRKLDETTYSMITNRFVLEINSFSTNNMEFPYVTGTKGSIHKTMAHSQRSSKWLKEVASYTQFLGLTSCDNPKVNGWLNEAHDDLDQICWKENFQSHKPLCLFKQKPLLASDEQLIYNQGGLHLLASDGMEFCLDASPRQKRTSKELKSSSFSPCRSDANQMWELNNNGSLISNYSGICAAVNSIDGEIHVALFNLNSVKTVISAKTSDMAKVLPGRDFNGTSCHGREVWSGKDFEKIEDLISMEVEVHGCALFVNCL